MAATQEFVCHLDVIVIIITPLLQTLSLFRSFSISIFQYIRIQTTYTYRSIVVPHNIMYTYTYLLHFRPTSTTTDSYIIRCLYIYIIRVYNVTQYNIMYIIVPTAVSPSSRHSHELLCTAYS